MLKKILEALSTPPGPANANDAHRSEVAVAALMVEAARLDKEFDATERATIVRLVSKQFDLSDQEAHDLVDVAEQRQKENYSDWIFTKSIKEGFSVEERQNITRKLWEVAFADGSLHRFEDHMINRVATELGLDAAAIEAARGAAQKA